MFPAKYRPATGIPSVSLVHFDGTNGSTSFPDVYPPVWTAQGGAKLTTSNFKFGTASLALNGTADYILASDQAAFHPGSGDFTYEAQIYLAAHTGVSQVIFNKQQTTLTLENIDVFVAPGNGISAAAGDGTSWIVNFGGSTVIPVNTWTHIAFVRFGNIWTIYVNGVADATVTASGTVSPASISQSIGAAAYNQFFFGGNIDETRISQVARYTTNFTPPSAPFTF